MRKITAYTALVAATSISAAQASDVSVTGAFGGIISLKQLT